MMRGYSFWPLLFLLGEEDTVLSADMVLMEDDGDDEDDEGEGEGDDLFLFFLWPTLPHFCPISCRGEGRDICFFLGGVGLLLTCLRLGATSLSKEEEVSFSPLFFVESL